MLTALLALLLGFFILRAWWTPRLEGMDGFVPYTDEEKDLLLKNESNLSALKAQMDEIREASRDIEKLQASCDANALTIQSLLQR
jgi:hypothetical protein